jgi:hypothetical protein
MTPPRGVLSAVTEPLFHAPLGTRTPRPQTPSDTLPPVSAGDAPAGEACGLDSREEDAKPAGPVKPRRNRKSAKAAGTRAETAIANLLRDSGFPYAERRAKTGAKDTGDISGLLGGVVEVKDCAKMSLSGWLKEAKTEQTNAGAWWSAVWHKKTGKGSPADWYVTLDGASFIELLKAVYDVTDGKAGNS